MPTVDRAGTPPEESSIRTFLIQRVAEHCRLSPREVDPDRPLAEVGLASRDLMALVGELEEFLDRSLPASLVYEFSTIARLAHALARRADEQSPRPREAKSADIADNTDIAVIGLGCRLPGGVQGPEAYWRLLLEQDDVIAEVPAGRWEHFDGVITPVSRLGGFLADVAGFDSPFFEITPGEADAMDPQQRILLEVAWEAFEHAGMAPASLRGSRTGVFVGVSAPEYALLTAGRPDASAWTTTGTALSITANRLSYLLDLRGPSMTVDTACSSSLVAVHLAARSLRSGESDVAVAGGVNVLVSPAITMTFEQAGGTAADGRCKAFDASADGMVRAEGCGIVILKRLGDAHRDGDRVLAVIRKTVVNSDGRSNGLVAPNPEAQEALLRDAYAGREPPDYVEAHGTGTLLGDPIEAHALSAALDLDRSTPLLIGSVKTNLGHLEAAAGIAGLIKVVLALRHRTIPASLHYHRPNPHIDFPELGLKVAAEQTPWPSHPGSAGVSSFGFGGTNAHVVLEEAPRVPWTGPEAAPVHTLLLSDVSADRIGEYAGLLADDLGDPADVAYTLARRFGRGRYGAAVVGRDRDALVAGLRALHSGRPSPAAVTGADVDASAPVWVFSGYGSQWPGMAHRLLTEEPVFARTIELLEPFIEIHTGLSVWDALDREETAGATLPGTVSDPADAMIILFAVQVGLARLWQSYGAEPAAVIGHSMGEVAGAFTAGAVSLWDAARVIARRARLLRTIAGGGVMAVLGASAEETAELSAGCPGVEVAVRSAPRQTVITGDADQVATVVDRAERRGMFTRVVRAEGAGHSSQVEPLMDPLRQRLADLRPAAPRLPFYSTVLDDPRAVPAFDADYWAANLRNPVRLVDAVQAAAEDGHRTFVEISPHPLLTHALTETVEDAHVFSTLRRPTDGERADDTITFHARLAELKLAGLPVRIPTSGLITDVPSPPWRHRHHWEQAPRVQASPFHPLLGAHVQLPDEQDRHVWTTNVGANPPPWRPVHGVDVLPIAAHAEIALAAGSEVLGCDALAVSGLRVERLLPLDARTTITTTCTVVRAAQEARITVQMRTPAGISAVLSRATVVADTGTAATARPYSGKRVTVPPAQAGGHRFRLHPVVLDACLAAFGTEWTAMAIGRLRAPGPAWQGGHCELTVPRPEDGTAVAGLRLLDDAGTVLFEADDVVLHRLPATAVPVPLAAKLIEVGWHRTPVTPPGTAPADVLLLCDPADTDAGGVTEALTAAGAHVARLRHDATPDELREALSRDPARLADVAVLVPSALADEDLLLAMTGLIRRLPPVRRLWITTRRAIAVEDGEAGRPEQAFLRALTRVLAFEQPALRATLVDVDDPAVLSRELLGDGADTEVAWRDAVRYAARLRPARLGEGPPRSVVRPGGAYVISGGYGGLGLVTARLLAERGAGRLVLGGRSGPGPDAQRVIDELRSTGVEVEIVTGDVAAAGTAERMVAAARRDGLRLCGVVHAAGALDDRLVADLGPHDLRRVWSPKVDGAVRLHEVTQEIDLDWWAVYSSAAASLGSPGQAAYAAANARVDALVDQRRARGLPATTINWGPWAEVGGAAGRTVAALDPLTPEEGADALEALLAHDRAATGVLRFNATRALAAFPEIGELPYFAALIGAGAAETTGRDDWPGPAALRAADPDAARRILTARVRDRVSAVLGFTPDPTRPLTELGLDSLVAVRIRSALEHDFGVTVPSSVLLRDASLTALQERLCGLLSLPAGSAPTAAEKAVARRVVRPLTEGARWHLAGHATPGPQPFFCVHAAGGDSGVYRQLAALLGEDQVFYGLERFEDAPGVEERAARYTAAIRAVQPEGPYRLGGWSFGGVLAYEIARRLGSAVVELVALIDAGVPRRVANPAEASAHRYADFGAYLTRTYEVPVSLPFEELAALDEEQQLALVIERTEPVMRLLPPAVAAHQFTSHQDTRALERYSPGPYDGRTVLYRSTEPTPWTVHDARYDLDEANGLADLCPRLEIVPVPGTHHLDLLDQPGVQIIADHLRALLGGATGAPAVPGRRDHRTHPIKEAADVRSDPGGPRGGGAG
ncbi:SDR family NAD(P)-dependent oxidoreductase [Actinomadura vinacea]